MGTLNEVADITMGQSPDSRYYSEEEVGLPFLQGCAEFQDRFPLPKLYCSTSKKIAAQGAILFSVRAPVGRQNIAERDYVIGRGLAAIQGKQVAQCYLEHFLALEAPKFSAASQGSTFEAINSSELTSWPVVYPTDRSEQSKIAEVLSTVDRAIAQTEALIAKQQRIKTGLMQDLLTRGIDKHGQLRSEATHAFKDSPLGRIPVEWEVEALGRIATVSGGKRLPAGHSYAKGKTGYVYLRVLDFFNREIDVDSLVSLESETFQALQRYEICHGELCISIAGSLGYVSVLRLRADIRAILTENALRIVPGSEVDGDYLYMAMNGLAVQKQVEALKGTGGGVPKLALHRVKSLSLAFPRDQAEQQRIVERVAAHAMNASQIDKALRKLRHLKTALMQDLLTGKVRVTPLLQQVVASANPQAKPAQRQRAAHTTLNPQPRIS